MILVHFSVFISVVVLFMSWTDASPLQPIAEECSEDCTNNGLCLTIDNGPKCYCLPEWEGDGCSYPRRFPPAPASVPFIMNRIDVRNTPCSFVPDLCKNQGVCGVDGTKLMCHCKDPYAGPRCTDLSPCADFCFNGGICTINNDAAECKCTDGFSGQRCNVRETTTQGPTTSTTTETTTTHEMCSFLPDGYCNAGSCVVEGTQMRCQCPPTHTGEQCDIPVGGTPPPTPATPPPATNPPATQPPATNPPATQPPATNPPATATPPTQPLGSTISAGPPGVKPCSSNPCLNGGQCFNNGNTFVCACPTPFAGMRCESSG